MTIKSIFKKGDIIKITGYKANNPKHDIGELAKVTQVAGIQVYYHTLKDLSRDPSLEKNGHPGYYCYSNDCVHAKTLDGDHIIARMARNGERETLLEMGLIDKKDQITEKGYKFLDTFE